MDHRPAKMKSTVFLTLSSALGQTTLPTHMYRALRRNEILVPPRSGVRLGSTVRISQAVTPWVEFGFLIGCGDGDAFATFVSL